MGQRGLKEKAPGRPQKTYCLMPSGLRYLKSPHEFRKIFDEGKRQHCPHFLLCFVPKETGVVYPRLGISISKANIPLAVQRNRIKRLVREAWQKKKYEKLGKNAVIVAKKGTDALKNNDITREITDIFDKLLS